MDSRGPENQYPQYPGYQTIMVWLDNLDTKQCQTQIIQLDTLDVFQDTTEINCLIKQNVSNSLVGQSYFSQPRSIEVGRIIYIHIVAFRLVVRPQFLKFLNNARPWFLQKVSPLQFSAHKFINVFQLPSKPTPPPPLPPPPTYPAQTPSFIHCTKVIKKNLEHCQTYLI